MTTALSFMASVRCGPHRRGPLALLSHALSLTGARRRSLSCTTHRAQALLLQKMAKVLRILSNKARFVEEVCTGDLVVSNRKRKDLLADLKERGYDLIPKEDKKAKSDSAESDDDAADDTVDESASDAELARGYEYLLGMKIWSLTFERAEELRRQKADKEEDLARLQATPSEAIWLTDLDAIDEALDERDVEIAKDLKKEVQAQSKNKARNAKKKVSAAKKAKKATRKADTVSFGRGPECSLRVFCCLRHFFLACLLS